MPLPTRERSNKDSTAVSGWRHHTEAGETETSVRMQGFGFGVGTHTRTQTHTHLSSEVQPSGDGKRALLPTSLSQSQGLIHSGIKKCTHTHTLRHIFSCSVSPSLTSTLSPQGEGVPIRRLQRPLDEPLMPPYRPLSHKAVDSADREPGVCWLHS